MYQALSVWPPPFFFLSRFRFFPRCSSASLLLLLSSSRPSLSRGKWHLRLWKNSSSSSQASPRSRIEFPPVFLFCTASRAGGLTREHDTKTLSIGIPHTPCCRRFGELGQPGARPSPSCSPVSAFLAPSPHPVREVSWLSSEQEGGLVAWHRVCGIASVIFL